MNKKREPFQEFIDLKCSECGKIDRDNHWLDVGDIHTCPYCEEDFMVIEGETIL